MQKPNFNFMYGITHTLDGEPVVREPKLLKVGIGCPKGPAVDVCIAGGKWMIRAGYKGKNGPGEKIYEASSKEDAKKVYWDITRNDPPVCPYPRKLPYFTFSRLNPDNTYSPDFNAIEAHGERPTEIDIVFLDEEPFRGKYAMWSASELKCHGDGLNAERVLSMASTDDERRLAKESSDAGEKFFPVVHGCWTTGCQYSKEFTDSRGRAVSSPCKPSGDLRFQLAHHIRVGGTAYFHTTGYRSISQLFSSLYRFRLLTGGRIQGIPFKMLMRPFRTLHNDQPGQAFGVSLEFRAEDIAALQTKMIAQGAAFFRAAELPPPTKTVRAIEAAADADEGIVDADEDEPLPAAAIESEFGGFDEGEESDTQPDTDSSRMEKATAQSKSKLVDTLKAKAAKIAQEGPPKKQAETKPATEPEEAAQEEQPSDNEAPPAGQAKLIEAEGLYF